MSTGAPSPPVIAYIEFSGVNAYHDEFSAPSFTAHPSSLLAGYPPDAVALTLHLNTQTFAEAWTLDASTWESLSTNTLYYVPGTRIVGLIEIPPIADSAGELLYDQDPISHGTAVAGAGSGNLHGSAPESLIVFIKTNAPDHALEWISQNPWIDLVSVSHGNLFGAGWPGVLLPYITGWQPEVHSEPPWTYHLTQQGRSAFYAAGNGFTGLTSATNLLSDTAGPPWVFAVGGYKIGGAGAPYICPDCDRPFEIAAQMNVQVPIKDTLSETRAGAGTSISSPRAAGFAARLIWEARGLLGHSGGFSDGAYARAPPGGWTPSQGPLADGVFDRDDMEGLLRAAAIPVPIRDPFVLVSAPTPEAASFLYQGYGTFDEASYQRALTFLQGYATPPARPFDDLWHAAFDAVAYQYWYPTTCAYFMDGDVARWPECLLP